MLTEHSGLKNDSASLRSPARVLIGARSTVWLFNEQLAVTLINSFFFFLVQCRGVIQEEENALWIQLKCGKGTGNVPYAEPHAVYIFSH